MNGDHASNQKKTVCLMLAWKEESLWILLGWEHLQTLMKEELMLILSEVKIKVVDKAGGFLEWVKLTEEDQHLHYKAGMDALALKLGEEQFKTLPEDKKQDIDLFFWAGCSMHKELNLVVGGYAVLEQF
ncbi:hypothetical protein Moror_11131 [Moniliophthora roreri MCA 2997]|nr:hypothetical protein Moror_11131 [Moniliophthora roreri MCA 2997]